MQVFKEATEEKKFTDESTSAEIWVKVYKDSKIATITDREGADLRLREMPISLAIKYAALMTQATAWANNLLNPPPTNP